MSSHVWDLNEHRRDEIYTLQHLKVDMHVEWYLPLLLLLLLLGCPLMLPLRQQALS